MSNILKTACIQVSAGPDIAGNISVLDKMIREAAGNGARLVATPENSCHVLGKSEKKLETASAQDDHPLVAHMAALAKELDIWILIGSVSILLPHKKLANRQIVFTPEGKIAATYDKIHLFDVDLPNGDKYRESDFFEGGDKAVTTDIDGITCGLSICYDVRFAYLYRELAKRGAKILTIPAAFTVPTGEAHWETLLRGRAIETGSYVIAPAQTGEHDGGRKTWGHSMIIDPWGRVLADAGEETGIIYADLDMAEVDKARASIPALRHDRKFN